MYVTTGAVTLLEHAIIQCDYLNFQSFRKTLPSALKMVSFTTRPGEKVRSRLAELGKIIVVGLACTAHNTPYSSTCAGTYSSTCPGGFLVCIVHLL